MSPAVGALNGSLSIGMCARISDRLAAGRVITLAWRTGHRTFPVARPGVAGTDPADTGGPVATDQMRVLGSIRLPGFGFACYLACPAAILPAGKGSGGRARAGCRSFARYSAEFVHLGGLPGSWAWVGPPA
jgi:hypothetical protein